MIDGFSDPYEQADGRIFAEAKLVTPQPAEKNKKIVIAGLVLAGLVLGMVILGNVAGLLTRKSGVNAPFVPKPVTMTKQEGQNFAQQQAGQAAYLQGQDRDQKLQANEDTVLGQTNGLASDAYDEVDGVPKKTKAQDDAEHGRTPGGQSGGGKSEAEQLRERAALQEQQRRENDLNSSPVAVDFSEYFEKDGAKPAVAPSAPVPSLTDASPEVTAMEAKAAAVAGRSRALADAVRTASEGEVPEVPTASTRKQPHDPSEDYTFDSSSGKLYRLMEDTIVETVLVNRLTGAAVGPVITMVTADVYSASGAHLLIPKGTRLLGRVSAVASLNQERLFVAFHRMIMPDGYSVSLDKFQGLDVVGQNGLRDLVNHHYVEIFGAAIALAAVSAASQVGNNGGSYGTYDWGVSMRNGVSQGIGQNAQRVMERFLNVLPTFTIRERARVKIMLAGDLLLPDSKNHTMDPDL
jgi:type IV secretion system protein VirB10